MGVKNFTLMSVKEKVQEHKHIELMVNWGNRYSVTMDENKLAEMQLLDTGNNTIEIWIYRLGQWLYNGIVYSVKEAMDVINNIAKDV